MADDYLASTATTGTVAIGGSTTGNIETMRIPTIADSNPIERGQ